MKVIKSKSALSTYLIRLRSETGVRIGLVPTMGYLHEGHLKLVRKALSENKFTVVSIFVNPMQFGPKEDLATYPQNLSKDLSELRGLGVSCVFLPNKEAFYKNHQTFINNTNLGQCYCGITRPIFFQGVLTVVMKLLQVVQPDQAYFGEKDYQQLYLIKKMVSDFDLTVKIKSVSTARMKNGLALSSRNAYLNNLEQAALFFKTLKLGRLRVRNKKIKSASVLVEWIKKQLLSYNCFKVDYIVVVDKDLQEITSPKKDIKGNRILGAVYFEKVRLIDNIMV